MITVSTQGCKNLKSCTTVKFSLNARIKGGLAGKQTKEFPRVIVGIKISREKIPPLLILCGNTTLLKKTVPLNNMFKNEISTEASHIFKSKTLKSLFPKRFLTWHKTTRKKGSILQHEEFYLPLMFSSPYALLFNTVKDVYYILGLKQ